MSNEIAYTVSAKAQLRVLVSWWLMATKTLRLKVRAKNFSPLFPILQSSTSTFSFSLLISRESSRRSSHKKDSISEKKFRKRFHADVRKIVHADVRKCKMQISADNFVKIDGKLLGLNSCFFTSHFSIVHYPLIHSCPLKIRVQSLSWAVQE